MSPKRGVIVEKKAPAVRGKPGARMQVLTEPPQRVPKRIHPAVQTKLGQELLAAAEAGEVGRVKSVLSSGAKVNVVEDSEIMYGRCWTPLIHAAYLGHTETVIVLIQAGADVNATGKKWQTSLMYAAEQGHLETVQALVEAKADINATDKDGWRALEYAEYGKHPEIVVFLRGHGAEERTRMI